MVDYNTSRETVVRILNSKGPLLPSSIARELQTNIIFASAILAELVSSNHVKLSNLKIGGSPLYYVQGHESKLTKYKDKLNEKDVKTYELLETHKVLRDSDLEPLTRVSLKNIKDFAVPLEVSSNNGKEIFWKWFMLSNEDAEKYIKEILNPAKEKELDIEEKENPDVPSENTPEEKSSEANEEQEKKEPLVKKDTEQQKSADQKSTQSTFSTFKPSSKPSEQPEDGFFKKVQEYLSKKNISIINYSILKKSKDIELEITVPSTIGDIMFYCRAKDKKKPNDSDLATAFVQGEVRKLPVFFLSTGEITKKAREMQKKEFNKMIVSVL